MQSQLDGDEDLKEHQTLTTKVKNATRWLGLWAMSNRNRRLGPDIRKALTGDKDGWCSEVRAIAAPRPPAKQVVDGESSDNSDSDNESSSADDIEEGARAANKKYPLAHRCMAKSDFELSDIGESILDRAREVTLLMQDTQPGYGEGLDG